MFIFVKGSSMNNMIYLHIICPSLLKSVVRHSSSLYSFCFQHLSVNFDTNVDQAPDCHTTREARKSFAGKTETSQELRPFGKNTDELLEKEKSYNQRQKWVMSSQLIVRAEKVRGRICLNVAYFIQFRKVMSHIIFQRITSLLLREKLL